MKSINAFFFQMNEFTMSIEIKYFLHIADVLDS